MLANAAPSRELFDEAMNWLHDQLLPPAQQEATQPESPTAAI
jgi:hypothetical protein